MMKKYRILVLTDHSKHSDQNSIYEILRQMQDHPSCESIHVASRGLTINKTFFEGMQRRALMGVRVNHQFKYTSQGKHFKAPLAKLNTNDFNLVFMRLPRPISDEFLKWLEGIFSHAVIVNSPKGIITTSNKKYLANLPEVCPDVKLCHSLEDIYSELKKYPIVLKPLREYGGKGILKLDGEKLYDGINLHETGPYLESIRETIENSGYISMRFLKNVDQGDKRILVVKGEILAASLRLPATGSWLCNVSQGGTSEPTEVTKREEEIIQLIGPALEELGIVIFGVDTLVDDDGERILSEINTLSIGGFAPAEVQTGKPVIKSLLDKIFEYADERTR